MFDLLDNFDSIHTPISIRQKGIFSSKFTSTVEGLSTSNFEWFTQKYKSHSFLEIKQKQKSHEILLKSPR